jgi:diguanylate cyclase (GGDEF)-like protein
LLTAFLFASGAPLLVFWLWPHSAALNNEIARAHERNFAIASTLADALAAYYAEIDAVFGAAAPRIAAGETLGVAEPVMRALHFRHICVIEAETGVVAHAVAGLDLDCPARLSPRLLERVAAILDAQRAGARRLFRHPDGAPTLLMAERVGPYIALGGVSTARFRELAGGVRFGAAGHALVLDIDGRALAHPVGDWADQARDLSGLIVAQATATGPEGVASFFSPTQQREMVAGFSTVAGTGWRVIVPQPMAEIEAQANEVTESARLVFAAGLVLSAALALAFSTHLSRGLGHVARAAQEMAAGDESARVPEAVVRRGLHEIALLGRSFNAMADRIEHSRERMTSVARTDALTGLLNRDGFFHAADLRIDRAREAPAAYALFFIDLDQFKVVNDSFGHAAGDEMLREVARRLRQAAPGEALIARQGGDEFLVLVRKTREGVCAALGRRLLKILSLPIAIGDRRITVSASIGVSAFPRDADDVHGLVLRADQAMYQAKRDGRNSVRFFDGSLQQRLDEDRNLLRQLTCAVHDGEVAAQFQPIVHARSGAIAGFEALARWTSPTLGPVAAERFIAMAEESGLIVEIGRQMREQACGFARALRQAGAPHTVSVNVCQRELAEPDFAPRLLRTLADHDLPPSAIQLEITESLFQSPSASELESLFQLKRQGVTFALDDFGKGYSSHSRLRTYPIDRLKIAVDFVGDVMTDAGARAVVRSLIDLGRRLRLGVTVEGVETAAQRDLVATLGADEIQGFWHHRPLDASAAVALAVRSQRMAAALAS